jgi:cardiolipin synthase
MTPFMNATSPMMDQPDRRQKVETRTLLTYANQLTILRMVFIPWFVLLVIYGHPKAATLLFVLAGATDGLDGLLARKLGQKTVLGSFLDPMADKLLLTAAFVTLTIPSLPLLIHIPIWLAVISISRDVMIALSALIIHLQTKHVHFPPSLLGKCTTAAQLLTVLICMMANFTSGLQTWIFPAAVYLTLMLTVGSGLHYFFRSTRIIQAYQGGGGRDAESRH